MFINLIKSFNTQVTIKYHKYRRFLVYSFETSYINKIFICELFIIGLSNII